jgi:hypothetical protein
MITFGVKPNYNTQQVQSLGSVATGDTHTFARFRTGANGASLHPLQRTGEVSASSHGYSPRMTAGGPPGLHDNPGNAVPAVIGGFPPLLQYHGSARDPLVQI